jgi:plasmid stabilization system protein ParE
VIAGRPRDLEDARTILIKNPDVDRRYIRDWLKQFEESLDTPFLKRFDELEQGA